MNSALMQDETAFFPCGAGGRLPSVSNPSLHQQLLYPIVSVTIGMETLVEAKMGIQPKGKKTTYHSAIA